MKRRLVSICVLLVGVLTFCLMECDSGVSAFAPKVISYPLIGKVIGIDPGHGGYDGGCEGEKGTIEKNVNLEISLLVKAELEDRGATVVMSRESDMALIDPKSTKGYKKRQELNHRLILLGESHVEAMISIHMNASTDRTARGARVFFKEGETEGQKLAQQIAQKLIEHDTQYAKGACIGDYYMLNACPASVLVECGFLTNPVEEVLLTDKEVQKELSVAICDGIEEYFAQNVVMNP